MGRWMKAGAAAAAVAVGIPLAVVIAGGPSNVAGDDVARQTAVWTGKQEPGKKWKPVPETELGGPSTNVVSTPGLLSMTVSAQMSKGAAKFRLVPAAGGPAEPPGAVRFDARAANSFSWAIDDTCGPGQAYSLEWKRVGKGKAVAAKIATHTVWNDFCL